MKETYTDASELTAVLNGTKANKERFLKLCYKEAIFWLQTLFFGEDAFSQNASHQLKQVISTLQPEPSKGIEKYRQQVTELQSYVPYTLWEQGMKLKGAEKPEPLSMEELRGRLGNNINKAQRYYLKQKGHDLYKIQYSDTLMILHCGEQEILQRMITIKAREKAEKDKYQKKNLLKRKGVTKKTKCKHWGNFHKGECRLKETADNLLKGGKRNHIKKEARRINTS